ncbi:MAG: hypothetical protein GEV06_16675 [Luteitalea sp.]|nr:hypothetical protein [Luteitalea sp.]
MIRLEVTGNDTAEFLKNLGGFLVMLRSVQQAPIPAAPANDQPADTSEPKAETPNAETLAAMQEAEQPKEGEVIPPEPDKKTRGRPKKEAPTIDATAEKAPEIGDVRTALMELIKHADETTAIDLLKDKGGTAKLKDVPAEKYAAVIKAAHVEIDRVKATA